MQQSRIKDLDPGYDRRYCEGVCSNEDAKRFSIVLSITVRMRQTLEMSCVTSHLPVNLLRTRSLWPLARTLTLLIITNSISRKKR